MSKIVQGYNHSKEKLFSDDGITHCWLPILHLHQISWQALLKFTLRLRVDEWLPSMCGQRYFFPVDHYHRPAINWSIIPESSKLLSRYHFQWNEIFPYNINKIWQSYFQIQCSC